MSTDVYAKVTDAIVASLEAGTKPWQKSWKAGTAPVGFARPIRSNGQPYQGVNVLLLWSAAAAAGYVNPQWMTYKQAQELGGNVRKGEKASLVVYANRIEKSTKNEAGEDEAGSFFMMRGYSVFNVEQIDGLPARFATVAPAPITPAAQVATRARVDAFIRATQATIRHGGDRAFYSPAHDLVQMPQPTAFVDGDAYYATLAHELTHWTSHADRCARTLGKRFGDEAYAVEELVAELGAAFLCASLGIGDAPREDHASYLASWLRILKADKKAIFTAASAAQKAADYLLAFEQSEAIAA
jgi:antirestriction protein ArdC